MQNIYHKKKKANALAVQVQYLLQPPLPTTLHTPKGLIPQNWKFYGTAAYAIEETKTKSCFTGIN